MNYLKKARKYLEVNRIDENKKPRLHLTPEIGWLNDPNGFSYYNGKYHLFYQFFPYRAEWNAMHWGHATSDDCIKWNYELVALAPLLPTAFGKACYSGSALVKNDTHYLIFTENYIGQRQCIAYSKNGVDYTRQIKPIIRKRNLPKDINCYNFRDPKVWQKGDYYYLLAGARINGEEKKSNIILFKSKDLFSWEFQGKLFSEEFAKKHFESMVECPDFITIDGKDILIFSPWRKQKVYYMIGELDCEKGTFCGTEPCLVDNGGDYFATQTITTKENEPLVIAWAQPNDPESVMQKYGWNGVMTLPRKMEIKNDKLYFTPYKELDKYFTETKELTIEKETILPIKGDCIDMEVTFDKINEDSYVKLYADKDKGIKIYHKDNKLYIDRKDNYQAKINCEEDYIISSEVNIIDEKLKLRIILDKFILEIFANDGEKAFSTLVSPTENRQNIIVNGSAKVKISK